MTTYSFKSDSMTVTLTGLTMTALINTVVRHTDGASWNGGSLMYYDGGKTVRWTCKKRDKSADMQTQRRGAMLSAMEDRSAPFTIKAERDEQESPSNSEPCIPKTGGSSAASRPSEQYDTLFTLELFTPNQRSPRAVRHLTSRQIVDHLKTVDGYTFTELSDGGTRFAYEPDSRAVHCADNAIQALHGATRSWVFPFAITPDVKGVSSDVTLYDVQIVSKHTDEGMLYLTASTLTQLADVLESRFNAQFKPHDGRLALHVTDCVWQGISREHCVLRLILNHHPFFSASVHVPPKGVDSKRSNDLSQRPQGKIEEDDADNKLLNLNTCKRLTMYAGTGATVHEGVTNQQISDIMQAIGRFKIVSKSALGDTMFVLSHVNVVSKHVTQETTITAKTLGELLSRASDLSAMPCLIEDIPNTPNVNECSADVYGTLDGDAHIDIKSEDAPRVCIKEFDDEGFSTRNKVLTPEQGAALKQMLEDELSS